MKHFLPILFLLTACTNKQPAETALPLQEKKPAHRYNRIAQYTAKHLENGMPSRSLGTVGNGKLVNGKLLPFAGSNFRYFDTSSYLNGHAFVHEKVRAAVMESYAQLQILLPQQQFCIMECSKEEGGRIFPHRTHQNGLSIDFMMPLRKNGQPYYGLDSSGQVHYLIDFDDSGRYKKDTSIAIDFETMALHLQALQKAGHDNGLRIAQVILKLELRNEFYATATGHKLKGKIYLVQKLSALINRLHDDHYHVDFEVGR